MSVKNGAELLDRLMKDIVADAAATYVSIYLDDEHDRHKEMAHSLDGPHNDHVSTKDKDPDSISHVSPSRPIDIERTTTHSVEHLEDRRAFSLERFIPLLQERVYAISPYTRMHLVSWLMILNTVPDLELVSYLPEFLDGLL
jgi:vacuole morphology and inheritance protein 14